jgi:signal peptidase
MPIAKSFKTFRKNHPNIYEGLELVVVVIVAWLGYQALGVVLDTPMPMVSVVSGSMEPTMHVGDLAIISNADFQVGDIAIYMRGKMTIIHRIIEIRPEGYVFKGDNNPSPDPSIVSKELVLGKVRFVVPLLGYPRLALYAIGI